MPHGQNRIPLPVIKRLPRYLRHVQGLQTAGVATVSSSELARILGTTASQVRQDFNCFGGFGQQGVGYNVELLCGKLKRLLVGGSPLTAVLIGTGKLGRTISGFLSREAPGFKLVAAFDIAPDQIGQRLGELSIRDMAGLRGYCAEHRPQVAVLCIPEDSAELLAPLLPDLGITGIWNFSHHDLAAQLPGIAIENVHLDDSLQRLGYRVRNPG
jgi:redox-sensing transcriptional repressor